MYMIINNIDIIINRNVQYFSFEARCLGFLCNKNDKIQLEERRNGA